MLCAVVLLRLEFNMQRVRVALIGTQFAAQHAAALSKFPEKAQVVAVCSRTEAHARAFAEKWNVASWTTDYDALLRREDVDAVHLCVPHDLHAPMTIAALHAGKHVLCEKPIALTIEDADAMLAAAKSAGKILMVNHNQRFVEGHVMARECVQRGLIGAPFLATAAFHMFHLPQGFRADAQRNGGGVVMDSGVHWLDLLNWIVGEVASVQAVGGRFAHHHITAEDTAVITLQFKNGALGQFTITWAMNGKTMFEPLKVLGTHGTLRVENDRLTFETREGKLSPAELAEREPWAREVLQRFEGFTGRDSVRLSVEHFIDCVQSRQQPLITPEEAREALRVALRVNEAMGLRGV
ncbi:MAG: Gfo/Idh/MocA family oxidoreductase [Abditibacteriales bacterium]|nr:Gfo/Idh/MocA family oxidoreductase [Abditibacteriales bacterium]